MTTQAQHQQLRDELSRCRNGQEHWCCPPELRQKVVEFAEQGKREGVPVVQMAKRLGLSSSGLRRWLASGRARVRPVRLQEPKSQEPSLVLVTRTGYRLEGLDASSAADVLRRLEC